VLAAVFQFLNKSFRTDRHPEFKNKSAMGLVIADDFYMRSLPQLVQCAVESTQQVGGMSRSFAGRRRLIPSSRRGNVGFSLSPIGYEDMVENPWQIWHQQSLLRSGGSDPFVQ
jgi:hypothetical protein